MLTFYIAILAVGFISGVLMETCPEPENIFPCKCTDLEGLNLIRIDCLSGYDLKTRLPLNILQKALNGLRGKNNVYLGLYDIQDTLPSNIFSGIDIKKLEVWACRMDGLTNGDQPGLLGLENHLEVRYSISIRNQLLTLK